MKNKLAKEEVEALHTKYTRCKRNVETLETELKSTKTELVRIKRAYEKLGKNPRAEIGELNRPSDP